MDNRIERLAYWYNRSERAWVIQQFDVTDWEVHCDYIPTREGAMEVIRQIEKETGLKAEKV